MLPEIMRTAESKMDKAAAIFNDSLRNIRGGRVSAALVEDIKVSYYGNPTPMKGVATINSPDPRSIVITPWDKDNLQAIETAIKDSDLNVHPSNDGSSVRLNFPPLTEERRAELTKVVKEKSEEAHIALRNIRHEALSEAKKLEQEGKLTEDDRYRAEADLNKLIEKFNQAVAAAAEAKQQEMMEI